MQNPPITAAQLLAVRQDAMRASFGTSRPESLTQFVADQASITQLDRATRLLFNQKYADPTATVQVQVMRRIGDADAEHLTLALLNEPGHLMAIYRRLAWRAAREEAAAQLRAVAQ